MVSTGETLTVYHAHMGCYGYRTLVALEEKGIAYEVHFVDIVDAEAMEPWFMKLNPLGQVPVMVHGSNCIVGSCKIMEYLESTFPEATVKLYPKVDSAEWQRMKNFLAIDEKLDIGTLVAGCYKYPEQVPKVGIFDQSICKTIRHAGFKLITEKAEEMAKKYPDMKDIYDRKKQQNHHTYDPSEELFKETLDLVHLVMDTAEAELEKTAKTGEAYLFGDSLTAGDICLAVFLKKIGMIGFNSFWKSGKHPLLVAYWEKIRERPSFKKILDTYEQDVKTAQHYLSNQGS